MNKLSFLVRKLAKEEDFPSAESLRTKLCEQYVEYQRRDVEELRLNIQSILDQLNRNKESSPSAENLMSMNRSLTSKYQRLGLTRAAPTEERNDIEGKNEVMLIANEEVSSSNNDSIHEFKSKKRKSSRLAPVTSPDSVLDTRYLHPLPGSTLADLAGLEGIVEQIRETVFHPIQFPHLYTHLHTLPPSGLLLVGPSGVGKTALAYAIAGESGLPFFKVRDMYPREPDSSAVGDGSGAHRRYLRRVRAQYPTALPQRYRSCPLHRLY